MIKNNVKLLSKDDLKELSKKYLFSLDDEEKNILVKTNTCARVTAHDINKSFRINIVNKRVIVFSLDAIEIWKELYNEIKCSLIVIQNAVNKLIVTFQKVNKENVLKILSGQDFKIKKL